MVNTGRPHRRGVAGGDRRAAAECLPIRTGAVDAATAVLTVHYWSDLAVGVSEMVRIARRRVVTFTCDHTIFQDFWLLREYLPAAAETDARLAVPISRVDLTARGRSCVHRAGPVPHDCLDGFGGAYWRRPHGYLEDRRRTSRNRAGHRRNTELEQQVVELRRQLAEKDDDLDAARMTNRELVASLNRSARVPPP